MGHCSIWNKYCTNCLDLTKWNHRILMIDGLFVTIWAQDFQIWSTVGIIIVEHRCLVRAQILTLFGLLSLSVNQSQNYKEYHTELIKSMFLLYRFLISCICLYYFVYGILIVWTAYYLSTNFIFFKKGFCCLLLVCIVMLCINHMLQCWIVGKNNEYKSTWK